MTSCSGCETKIPTLPTDTNVKQNWNYKTYLPTIKVVYVPIPFSYLAFILYFTSHHILNFSQHTLNLRVNLISTKNLSQGVKTCIVVNSYAIRITGKLVSQSLWKSISKHAFNYLLFEYLLIIFFPGYIGLHVTQITIHFLTRSL